MSEIIGAIQKTGLIAMELGNNRNTKIFVLLPPGKESLSEGDLTDVIGEVIP